MAKKLSTEEILKAARAQSGKAASPEGAPATPSAPAESGAQGAASEPAAAAVPPPTPTPSAASGQGGARSTKDILAAARAQATGGATTPAGPAAAKPAGASGPKSTKDILAAARAQTGAGTGPPSSANPGKSTTDILAAARAQTGGAAAAAPTATSAKAAAAKAAAGRGGVAPAAGNRPSVEEMLRAAREGRAAAEPGAKPAAPTLIIPQKPAAPVKAAIPVGQPRRGFLARLGGGIAGIWWVLFGTPFRAAWTSFTGALGLWSLETARFMMPNVLVEPPSKFKVGPPSDYPPAAVSTKWTAQYGVWVVRNQYKGKDIIYALQTVCTHLGCTPNWLEGERKFKCPCHGSGFYITGINFEGPAPRPLERMAIRISEDGMLEVDKSRKFQEELGQWEDPASYVVMA